MKYRRLFASMFSGPQPKASKPKPRRRQKSSAQTRRDLNVLLNVEPLEELDLLDGDDFGNIVADAEPISIDQGPAAVPGSIETAGDVDVFQLVMPRDGTLSLRQDAAGGSALDAFLRVLDQLGNEIAFDDDGGPGTNSALRLAVNQGDVLYVEAGGFDNTSIGDYTLTAALDDFGDTDLAAQDLPFVNDVAQVAGQIEDNLDRDVFRVVAPRDGNLHIIPEAGPGSTLSVSLSVRDEVGQPIASGLSFADMAVVQGQELFIEIAGFGETSGDYELSLQFDDYGDTEFDAQPVAFDAQGQLSVSGVLGSPFDIDQFRVEVPVDGYLSIHQAAVPGSTLSPFVTVFDEFDTVLDSGGFFGSSVSDVELFTPAGVYFIQTGSFNGVVDQYQLSAELLTDQISDNPLDSQPLALDGFGQATFDGVFEHPADVDVFQVTAAVDGVLRIRQDSTGMDFVHSAVAVFDEFGNPLAFDDVLTGDFDAQVQVAVVAGQTLFVQTGTIFNEPGRYRLSVTSDDYGDSFFDAEPVVFDAQNEFELAGLINNPFDEDYFQFTAPTSGLLVVQQVAAPDVDFSGFAQVFDANFNSLSYAYGNPPDFTTGTFGATVIAGETYYLRSGRINGTGPYQISAAIVPDDYGNSIATAEALPFDAQGQIMLAGEIEVPVDVDYFRVEVPVDGLLVVDQFAVLGGSLDTFLQVFDEFGNFLDFGDAFDSPDSRLEIFAPAGVYFVQAGSFDGGVGEYNISAQLLTDQIGDLPAMSQLLPLDAFGAAQVDGLFEFAGDADMYQIVANGDGMLRFRLDPLGDDFFHAAIAVLDEGGNLLTFDDVLAGDFDATVDVPVVAGQTVFVRAGTIFGETGRYSLSAISFVDDFGSSFATAQQVAFDAQDQLMIVGAIETPFDQDFFQFTATTSGLLVVQQTADFDTFGFNDDSIELYDANGNFIAFGDLQFPDFTINVLGTTVVAGESYFLVSSRFSSAGNYQISASIVPDDYGNTFQTAEPVAFDPQGQAALSGAIDASIDVDVFRLEVAADGLLVVQSTSVADGLPNPFIRVFDEFGFQLGSSDSFSPGSGRLEVFAAAGAYFVEVSSGDGVSIGQYQISARLLTDRIGNTIATAHLVSLDDFGDATVDEDGGAALETFGDVDVFQILTHSDDLLRIRSTSDGAILVDLRVFDALGNHLSNANLFTGFSVAANQTLYIEARGFSEFSVGTYQLQIDTLDDRVGNTPATAQLLPLNSAGEATTPVGSIETDGDLDVYEVRSTVTGVIAIQATAPFDSLLDRTLRILDATGAELARGDAAFSGQRAVFVNTVAGQSIFIEVGGSDAFGVDFATGDYTVSVEAVQSLAVDGAGLVSDINPHTDTDLYRIVIPASGLLSITQTRVNGGFFDSVVTLYDANGFFVGSHDGEPPDYLDSRLEVPVLQGQVYYVEADNYFDYSTGQYRLTATVLTDQVGDTLATAQPLMVGDGNAANIQGALEFAGDRDVFQYTAVVAGNVAIQATANSFGLFPALTIFDQSGAEIPLSDPFGGRHEAILAAGQTIFVQVAAANDLSFNPVGSYNLSFSPFRDDFGDTFASAQDVDLTDGLLAQPGEIEESFDVDVFRLVVDSSGLLTIQESAVPGGFFDAVLTVFDATGRQLAANDDDFSAGFTLNSRVQLSVTAGQILFIQAGAYSAGTGSYTLTASLGDLPVDDVGNTIQTANATALDDGSVSGLIEFGFDLDVYRYVAPASGLLVLTQTASPGGFSFLDTNLTVLDVNGQPVAFNDNDFSFGFFGSQSSVQIPVTMGQVLFVQASSSFNATGAYTLTAVVQPVADLVPAVGSTTVTAMGTLATPEEVDAYRFVAATDGLLTITQNATDGILDSEFTVLDAAGNFLAYGDGNAFGFRDALVNLFVSAGDVLFILSGGYFDSVGSYELTLSLGPGDDFGNTIATANANELTDPVDLAAIDDSVMGVIEIPGDVDVFRYQATAAGTLVVRQNATAQGGFGLDSFLRVFDVNGLQIASNDDTFDSATGFFSLDSTITVQVAINQVVYIQAGGFAGFSTGAFNLSVDLTPDQVNDDIRGDFQDPRALEVGVSFDSQIDASPGNADADMFRIEATFDGLLTIRQEALGGNLDSVLRVFDSNRMQIATNDDNGINLNSLITIEVNKGDVLFVQASSFGNSTGAYRLTAEMSLDDFRSANPQALPFDTTTQRYEANGTIDQAGDIDAFIFVTPDNGDNVRGFVTLTIEQLAADASGLDSFVRVFNQAGDELIGFNDDNGDILPNGSLSLASRLQITVPEGETLSIRAGGFGLSRGAYSLIVTAGDVVATDDVQDFITRSIPLDTEVGADGDLLTSGRIDTANDVDVFSFVATMSGSVNVSLDAAGIALGASISAIEVSPIDGVSVTIDRGLDGTLDFDVVQGRTYFVRATGPSVGNYNLAFQQLAMADPAKDITDAGNTLFQQVRDNFANGIVDVSQQMIDDFLASLSPEERAALGNEFLILVLDPPKDFSINVGLEFDANAPQFASSQLSRIRDGQFGNPFLAGGVVQLLVLPNPSSDQYFLSLTGLGETVRGSATFVSNGQIMRTVSIASGEALGSGQRLAVQLDFRGDTIFSITPGLAEALAATARARAIVNDVLGLLTMRLAGGPAVTTIVQGAGEGDTVLETEQTVEGAVAVIGADGSLLVSFELPEGLGTFRLPVELVQAPGKMTGKRLGPVLKAIKVTRTADSGQVALEFDRALDPQQAVRAEGYQLVWAGPNGQIGDGDDQVIDLGGGQVEYDAATHQVILRRRLPAGQYKLQIKPEKQADEQDGPPGNQKGDNLQGAKLQGGKHLGAQQNGVAAAQSRELDRLLAQWPESPVAAADPLATAELLMRLNHDDLDQWFELYSQTAASDSHATGVNPWLLAFGGAALVTRAGQKNREEKRPRPR